MAKWGRNITYLALAMRGSMHYRGVDKYESMAFHEEEHVGFSTYGGENIECYF